MQDKTLELIVARLAEVYHPEAIYLFGSRAWGTPREDSDFDLAVVVAASDESPWRRPQKGSLALWDLDASIDLLVFTRDEFQAKARQLSTLQHKIERDGVKIYDAA